MAAKAQRRLPLEAPCDTPDRWRRALEDRHADRDAVGYAIRTDVPQYLPVVLGANESFDMRKGGRSKRTEYSEISGSSFARSSSRLFETLD